MATGQLAFHHTDPSVLEMLTKEGRTSTPFPSVYSEDLQKLVEAMMSLDPESRPSVNQICSVPQVYARVQEIIEYHRLVSDSQSRLDFPRPLIPKTHEPLTHKHSKTLRNPRPLNPKPLSPKLTSEIPGRHKLIHTCFTPQKQMQCTFQSYFSTWYVNSASYHFPL